MFNSPMSQELAAARHAHLIAAADAHRLARHARRARRNHGGSTSGGSLRRTWLRTATQPAQP